MWRDRDQDDHTLIENSVVDISTVLVALVATVLVPDSLAPEVLWLAAGGMMLKTLIHAVVLRALPGAQHEAA